MPKHETLEFLLFQNLSVEAKHHHAAVDLLVFLGF